MARRFAGNLATAADDDLACPAELAAFLAACVRRTASLGIKMGMAPDLESMTPAWASPPALQARMAIVAPNRQLAAGTKPNLIKRTERAIVKKEVKRGLRKAPPTALAPKTDQAYIIAQASWSAVAARAPEARANRPGGEKQPIRSFSPPWTSDSAHC